MPSVFSHAVAGLSLGLCFVKPDTPRAVLALGTACAVLPDVDVTGMLLGMGLDDPFGHRGFSHSLAFAGLLASAITWAVHRRWPGAMNATRLWLYLAAATASHGVLDAMTNGGRGVAFLAPFLDHRYHFPFRPIEVSPIGVRPFFSDRGVAIMANELVWIWVPAIGIAVLAVWLRRRSTQGTLMSETRSSEF